mmetsp:Transcript_965/g.2929  ORF Transcript_965/g.2929 Transcript_965/m.2929 type:complete len:288 (-) Transcript_965:471-1334(-)|eukprot:CAMPEP_0206140010 /NCGR_PEP_ID=MMETSP1473-20131121/8002_1 /ASSEMBLY_ACC=CAM_ASM_001109 /TAXON_ID=1461547 /ORGANISM="Stichococcus sp, Strain RCC1054" /LENGTH=287 /DNA_ID=CAMNT_0053533989 /DNA_START=139 /DNA_END=1002 /DNA_ORIENTATION=+
MADNATGKDLISGTVAGAGQLVSGHPFDTIKVKLQTTPGNITAATAARKLLAEEGAKGFFKGLAAPLATVAVYNAVLFAARGNMERLLAHPDGTPLTIRDHVVCGAGAGVASALIACPTELLKCRLQSAPSDVGGGGKPGPIGVARQILAASGPGSLFRGMTPTLGREVGGSALMFGCYEAFKRQAVSMQGLSSTSELGLPSLMVCGGVAGMGFWASVYPFDTVKTMMQTDDLKAPKYRGMLDACSKMYASGGMRAFYLGFNPAIARSFVANGVAFCIFETTRSSLG